MGAGLPDRFSSVRTLYELARRVWGKEYYDNLLGAIGARSDELHSIRYSLPALFLVSMATVCAVQERSGLPLEGIADCVAGHSVGEFAAVTAAGGVKLEDMLGIVHGAAMKLQGMAFDPPCSVHIVKSDADTASHSIDEVGVREHCWVANINAPDQTVVSGHQWAMDRLVAGLQKKSIGSVFMRKVPIPVHSPLLNPVFEEVQAALAKTDALEPRVPFVASTTGQAVHADAIRDVIAGLFVQQVNWPVSMQCLMGGLDVRRFVECGPGRILSGLVGRNCPEGMGVSFHNLSSLERIEAYVGSIEAKRSDHFRSAKGGIGCNPVGVN